MFAQPDPVLTWTIFGITWTIMLLRAIYKRGKR